MASVLLCEDERLDRLVAVKRLHADSPADTERRFAREAKLGASLNHPNLVSVFDTATDDEGVLIVMEYVEGDPLSRELRRGPLIPDRVAKMATELGAALDHAHAQGVVHRDVKPGNVLLRVDGVTKLVDLGIATAADDTRITRSGTVLGTAAYMAPEQLEGDDAGPPADVYALAAVCFEALCGERPRSGRTPLEIAHAIATESPPDLRDPWPSAPAAAAEALRHGMARNPQGRPSSAGELASELSRGLEQPPTAPTRRVERRGPTPPVAAPVASPPARAADRPAAGSALAAADDRRWPPSSQRSRSPSAPRRCCQAATAATAARRAGRRPHASSRASGTGAQAARPSRSSRRRTRPRRRRPPPSPRPPSPRPRRRRRRRTRAGQPTQRAAPRSTSRASS